MDRDTFTEMLKTAGKPDLEAAKLERLSDVLHTQGHHL